MGLVALQERRDFAGSHGGGIDDCRDLWVFLLLLAWCLLLAGRLLFVLSVRLLLYISSELFRTPSIVVYRLLGRAGFQNLLLRHFHFQVILERGL